MEEIRKNKRCIPFPKKYSIKTKKGAISCPLSFNDARFICERSSEDFHDGFRRAAGDDRKRELSENSPDFVLRVT